MLAYSSRCSSTVIVPNSTFCWGQMPSDCRAAATSCRMLWPSIWQSPADGCTIPVRGMTAMMAGKMTLEGQQHVDRSCQYAGGILSS